MAAVSLSDLIQEVGVSEQQLNSRVSEDHLLEMSIFLPSRELAPFLGLNKVDMDVVELEGRGERDKRLKLLQRWIDKNAFKATYRKLIDALLRLEMASHAEKVCELLQPEAARSGHHWPDTEIKALRRENETLKKKTESLQAMLSKTHEFTRERDSLHSQVEELQSKLSTKTEEIEALQREKDSVVSSLRAEIERMRSEMASIQDTSRTKIESLQAEVQRLSVHRRTASSESPKGLSPCTRLQWRRGADAPEEISGLQAVVMGEKVYVSSGDYKVLQYDWRRDTWSTLSDCPVKCFGMAQFLGKLITVGGIDRNWSTTGKVYQFNGQQWKEFFQPMLTARYDLTVATRNNSSPKVPVIVACGGEDARSQKVPTVEVYSHASSQWHTPTKPLPISCWTSVTIDDTCYLLGGFNDAYSDTKRCFSVSLDSLINNTTSPHSQLHDTIWMSFSDTPLTLSTAASLRGSLIAIGGWDTSTNTALSAIHVLASNGSWERVREGDLPEPHYMSAAVCLPSGELLVVGGFAHDDTLHVIKKKTVFIASIAD